MSVAVARATCRISAALRRPAIRPRSAASRPAAASSAYTPPWIGVLCDVEPSCVETVRKFLVPQDVLPDRAMNDVVAALAAGPSTPTLLVSIPLPGTTNSWNCPPW